MKGTDDGEIRAAAGRKDGQEYPALPNRNCASTPGAISSSVNASAIFVMRAAGHSCAVDADVSPA